MKRWKDLGVVDTIYEEEDDHDYEDNSSSSHSLSDLSADDHLTASPPSPLQDIVKTWSLATGLQTEVVIHVQDQCFHLHKDPLISKSSYLKRHLMDSSEITISPPLKITAETFSSVIDFCYSYQTVITPFNVAALRIAAELLEMTGDNGRDDDSLRWKTESYFCQAVSVNREFAVVVLGSCLTLLPEAEETVSLTSRCIEALGLIDGIDEVDGWAEEIMSLTKDQLQMIADSMHDKLEYNHDLLYRILDYYIKGHAGKIAEEEKTMLCSSVDCNKLSPNLIMHAVQNPRMPLKFIVRAMLVEQLNTRHSIVRATIATTAITSNNHPHYNNNTNIKEDKEPITLGAILQRDATLRNVAQIKATMEATSSKIERLEKDLMWMKKLLNKNDQKKASSFRFSSEKVVSKGDRKWASFRFSDTKRDGGEYSPCSSERSTTIASTKESSLKWRFLNGLKTAFGMSRKHDSSWSFNLKEVDEDVNGDEDEDGFGLEEEHHYHHRRSRSFVKAGESRKGPYNNTILVVSGMKHAAIF